VSPLPTLGASHTLVCKRAHEVGEPGPAAACFHGLLVKGLILATSLLAAGVSNYDRRTTDACHPSVLPGTYGVAAMSWYKIGCVTLDSYQVRTPAENTWRESRNWRDVTDP
jgi:hypothetical protein